MQAWDAVLSVALCMQINTTYAGSQFVNALLASADEDWVADFPSRNQATSILESPGLQRSR